nr:fertilization-influencing membrane protein isoform X1 [Gorilla gorilla gorilla]
MVLSSATFQGVKTGPNLSSPLLMRVRDGGGVPAPSTFSPHPKVPSEQLWAVTSQSPHLMIGVMRLWPWVLVWVWLAALGAIETAPRPKRATASALGTESPRFLDRPDFFDYPDSDQARLLAVAQFIGEKPIVFINSGSSPGLFHHILVGFLVVAFFFLLFQFCTHINFQKGA